MTAVIQKNLAVLLEADSLSGVNGSSVVEWTDASANNYELAVGGNPRPTLKTNAVGGNSSINPSPAHKAVVWNGSANPLAFSANLTVRCGFVVCKITEVEFSDYRGILTAPTAQAILVGQEGANYLYDFGNKWFEYRLNDRSANRVRVWSGGEMRETLNAPAPMNSYGLVYFKFWNNIALNGLQIGQDRADPTRKLTGEIALVALYSDDLLEEEVQMNMRSIAYSYQIPLAEQFPFRGSKGDPRTPFREIYTDNLPEPNVRVKDMNLRDRFEIRAAIRSMDEMKTLGAFVKANYPDKSFLYKDMNVIPPEDKAVLFASLPQMEEDLNLSGYSFDVQETLSVPVSYSVPASAPTITI